LLGALLTFGNTPFYGESRDLADQQLAGLLMWVPGSLVYLAAAGWITWRWLSRVWRKQASTTGA
jgi:putative membrane protein